VDELGTGLDSEGGEEGARGGSDAADGVIEAVAVLAPAVRSQGEGERPDFDGSAQVDLLGASPSLFEEIESVGLQLAPS
jgi:hypothetical protein